MSDASPAPSPCPSPTPEELVTPETYARLKRKLQQLENPQNQPHKRMESLTTRGRLIPKIALMFGAVKSAVAEDDRRHMDPPPPPVLDLMQARANDRLHAAYLIMHKHIRGFSDGLVDTAFSMDQWVGFYSRLQSGGVGARGDDFWRIREELVDWLYEVYEVTFPRKERNGRGYQHDVTGRLICPVTLDWNDHIVRTQLRTATVNPLDLNYFLPCLYDDLNGNPDDLEKGFLMSHLLLKTWCYIFTSPSSASNITRAEKECLSDSEERPLKKSKKNRGKATKTDVVTKAGLVGTVTPRTIAYAAVMLVMNLTNMTKWRESWGGINFPALWDFIVDFLEVPPTDLAKEHVRELSVWWKSKVFPDASEVTDAQVVVTASMDILAAQREAKEARVALEKEAARVEREGISGPQGPAENEHSASRAGQEGQSGSQGAEADLAEAQRLIHEAEESARLAKEKKEREISQARELLDRLLAEDSQSATPGITA